MTDNKLKPCPFCDGEAFIEEHRFHGCSNTYGVKCSKCHTQSFQFCDTKEIAVKRWNTRAEIERLDTENKLLAKNSVATKYPCAVSCSRGLIFTKSLDEYDELIGDISAEAIKEFAERLKKDMSNIARMEYGGNTYFCVGYGLIDNLVKEMTEGQNESV